MDCTPVNMVGLKGTEYDLRRITLQFSVALVVSFVTLSCFWPPLIPMPHHGQVVPLPRWNYRAGNPSRPNSQNILCIFSGRWTYLRISFAYLYRSLRENGGVLDKVVYVMMAYDKETEVKLVELTKTANDHLGKEVFEIWFRNHNKDTRVLPQGIFLDFIYEIFDAVMKHPERKYFKMDDDIVYFHPGAFRQLIEQQNTSECFMHFANVGGANWRSSYIHQEMGLYDDKVINPKKLKFEFKQKGEPKCGWTSVECAEMALQAFLHHYKNQSLDRFLFDGRYLTNERAHYSINLLLLDANLIDVKGFLVASRPIKHRDEGWLTEVYSRKVKNPNCIVGRSFIVHFSYPVTLQEISKRDFLGKFERIAYTDLVKYLPQKFQTVLGFNGSAAVHN